MKGSFLHHGELFHGSMKCTTDINVFIYLLYHSKNICGFYYGIGCGDFEHCIGRQDELSIPLVPEKRIEVMTEI
jgi:hypothetical protein